MLLAIHIGNSGIVFDSAAMVDGMIDRVKEELGADIGVCVTGRYAHLVLPYCKREMTADEHLVLRGLALIYKKNV